MSNPPDMVNHPPHYTAHPSGVEAITICEHFNFCLGSAMKYLWRAGLKGDAIEDLRKARWYLDREIARREAALSTVDSQQTDAFAEFRERFLEEHSARFGVSTVDSSLKEKDHHGD